MDEENKISINDTHSYEIPKKSYKKVERVRIEATSLGRTNLLIQVDNICIVMYPRTEDIEELLKRHRIDCCIGCPTADVMLQLNNHFPQIEWVTWDMDFIDILIQNKIHPNRIHFTENYVAKKVIIQGLEFKMYKNNRGYIIKGPLSRILYLWAQEKNNKELSDEIKKQLKRLRPFQASFFCVNSLRNPNEIKTIFDLVKAQKNVLMFVKDRPLDDEINFVQTLISKGIKQEDLIVLEKSHDYQQDFFKYKARKNFLYYLKIWRKDSNESYHPLSTSIDTLSTL
uniref:Uncharacterized protein n=1 Tax=Acrobeloides nanus TaxID=290746 RepID=A0A914C6N7_9BILA